MKLAPVKFVACLCTLFSVVPGTVLARQAPQVSEYAVRAVLLYKIAKFVEWPESAFDDAHAPVLVCIAGTEAITREFKQLEQQRLGSRALVVRRVQGDATDLNRCHIAYLQNVPLSDLMYTVRRLHGYPVLAVGESQEFLNAGGSIALLSDDGRVTFQVNQQAARANQLRVSSQLLSIADRMAAKRQPANE